jgi:hypothetical protein
MFKGIQVISVALGALLSVPAIAGTKDGGGAVGFLCHEGLKDKVYLADTYNLFKLNKFNGKEAVDAGLIFLAAGEKVAAIHPVPRIQGGNFLSGWALIFESQSLQWEKQRHLPLLGDDHILTIPQNCKKVQLAIQDVVNGIVRWDDQLVSEMTPSEIGFFQLHETFVALRGRPGLDTTPIRTDVAAVLNSPDFNFAQFIEGVMDPNTLLPVQKDIGSYFPILDQLPGEYSGQDQLKRDCHATVRKNGEILEFTTKVKFADQTEFKMESSPIAIIGLAQKLAYDMDFKKRQVDYSPERMGVGYSNHSGLPSIFGTYPNTNSIHVNWYKGELSSISVESEVSNGGFRDINQSREVTCYGLVRTEKP